MKQLISILLVLSLTACATSSKVQVVQKGDTLMTEAEILRELDRLDEAQKQIDNNKGVTGTNVAAFLFFMPGLAYTYYDASEATKLINQRKSHLTDIYNQKYLKKQTAANDSLKKKVS